MVGGALFATASAHTKGGLLADLTGFFQGLEIVGVALELLALALASAAVFPLLGKTGDHRRAAAAGQIIYFGHLRHWTAAALSARLDSMTENDQRQMLAEQLINMAARNWRKHVLLQWSLGAATTGIGCVVASALWG